MEKRKKQGPLSIAAKGVRAALFPPYCAACRSALPNVSSSLMTDDGTDRCLCDACMSDFVSSVRETCRVCGEGCAVCECVPDGLAQTGVDRAYACFSYDKTKRKSASSAIIYKLKDCKNRDVTRFCAFLLARRLEKAAIASGADLGGYTVTFAPRRRRAVRENGADHMEKTAKLTAKLLGLPFEAVFVNTAHTAQKKKDAAARLDAAERSITVRKRSRKRIDGKRYILLDDILTSGATLAACVGKLYGHGADDVIVCTLAKTKST